MAFPKALFKFFTALGFIFCGIFEVTAQNLPPKAEIKTEKLAYEMGGNFYQLINDHFSYLYDYDRGGKGYYADQNPQPSWIQLASAPEGTKREYVILLKSQDRVRAEGLTEEEFFNFTRRLIDRMSLDITDNVEGYRNKEEVERFFKKLISDGLLKPSVLLEIAKTYTARAAIENAYILDNVQSGLFSSADWDSMAERSYGIPKKALAMIKRGNLTSAHDIMSKIVLAVPKDGQSTLSESYDFPQAAFVYGELAKRDVVISDEEQTRLFRHFVKSNIQDFAIKFDDVYGGYGLPRPKPEIMDLALKQFEDFDSAKAILNQIRYGVGRILIGKKSASVFRDTFLRSYADIADIQYLIKIAGEDATVELWNSYADTCWDWYRNKERRLELEDSADYFRATVAGLTRVKAHYDRVHDQRFRVKDSRLIALVDAAEADPDVRISDLIAAYALRGLDLRDESSIRRMEKRIERKIEELNGAYIGRNAEICWHLDSNGAKKTPLRDTIELEAYLGDPHRINRLAFAVRRNFLEKLSRDSFDKLSKIHRYKPELFSGVFMKQPEVQTELASVNTPAYADLNEIYRVYEELDFKRGAYAVGAVLFECGFVNSARRFYHLGGVREEAEGCVYKTKPDSYWREMEAQFAKGHRLEGIKNQKPAEKKD